MIEMDMGVGYGFSLKKYLRKFIRKEKIKKM
jgi:hypothetical protein